MNDAPTNFNEYNDDDDPIVAEVRRARTELFARFNYDLRALFEYLKARTDESAQAGRKVASPLAPRTSQPANKAG